MRRSRAQRHRLRARRRHLRQGLLAVAVLAPPPGLEPGGDYCAEIIVIPSRGPCPCTLYATADVIQPIIAIRPLVVSVPFCDPPMLTDYATITKQCDEAPQTRVEELDMQAPTPEAQNVRELERMVVTQAEKTVEVPQTTIQERIVAGPEETDLDYELAVALTAKLALAAHGDWLATLGDEEECVLELAEIVSRESPDLFPDDEGQLLCFQDVLIIELRRYFLSRRASAGSTAGEPFAEPACGNSGG